jgi:hypothetical protein
LATVSGLNRDLSDHVILLLATGTEPPHCNALRYENCWVEKEGSHDEVRRSWHAATYCRQDADNLQEKTRRLKRNLKD